VAIPEVLTIPEVLSNPSAHRARRCVLFLAEHPQASNREIASGIGVAHASQISKLLSCLLGERLVARHSAGAGKRNAWWLTSRGEEVTRALRAGQALRSSSIEPCATPSGLCHFVATIERTVPSAT
jgi:predicted transcriptional regulator